MESGISLQQARRYLLKYRLARIEQEIQRIENSRQQPSRQSREPKICEKFSKFYENLDIIRSCDEAAQD